MRYFFQFGVFQSLSLVELSTVLETYGISKDSIKNIGGGVFLLESKLATPQIISKIFSRLGGYIRYGEVIEDIDSFLPQFLEFKKVLFGVSFLDRGKVDRRSIEKLSNEIKKFFTNQGVSSRFILPKEGQLNEAQIRNNKILEKGFEFVIFNTPTKQMYGRTLGVQDVESFVRRDIDRPKSDYDMGVLPQKLARIMCNLVGLKDGIIWDPFCGSGTILMEAAVLGFDILGTDIDQRAISNSHENILWLHREGLIAGVKYNLFQLDIRNVEKKIVKDLQKTGIRAVVCEPFMGPVLRKVITSFKADTLLEEVKSLYTGLFKVLDTVAKKGFKVVLVIPSYKTLSGQRTLNISSLIGKKWDVLNKVYSKEDLKWERNNSIITRNIFILSRR
ncbi:MAG: TRM11 family SAM-dependent methyltransferase [Candidatus Dojkabacteria bacterium]